MLLVVLAALLSGSASTASPPPTMAALGDSVTRGFNTGFIPFRDAPSHSWAASAAKRLQYGTAFNDAKDGARMRDLPGQATRAAGQGVDRVLILMGANDVCHGSVTAMTSVTRFRSDFEAALRVFATLLPDARIEVLSIPDLYRLWQIESGRFLARTAWWFLHLCDALLANPRSTAPEDVARRALVRDRLSAFNQVLSDACAEYSQCTYDGGAAFQTRFGRGDISSRDFFHPSRSGQEKLADVAWRTTLREPAGAR